MQIQLFSRVNTDEVSFGVVDQRHIAVLADAVLTFINFAADFCGDRFFMGAVFTCEVHDGVDAAWDEVSAPDE